MMLLELETVADTAQLASVRDQVRSACSMAGCEEEFTSDIIVAVNEACMNVIQHAYRNMSGRMRLTIDFESGELVIRLMDLGSPVDPVRVRPRDLDDLRPGGLGTHFIQTLMDEVVFLPAPEGWINLLQMKKRI